MTFTENLESAKNGNRRSYGMLCNEFADKLYSVAFLVLDSSDDAENAVKSAFDDGFRAIERINDDSHLCAWLSRELTKHVVAKLKEYRAENRTVSGGDCPEKQIFCRLNDLDRLVCALNLAFGYKIKEITVITGLKEETAERKLNDSDKKLGKDKPTIVSFLENIKAPDSLITKMPKVHDLTVEIDSSVDEEMIGEMERIAALAEAEENGTAVPENPRLIRFQPAEEPPEEKLSEPEKHQKIQFIPPEQAFSDIKFQPKQDESVEEMSSAPVAEESERVVAPAEEEKSAPPVSEEVPVTAEEKQEISAPVEPEKPAAEEIAPPVSEEAPAPAEEKQEISAPAEPEKPAAEEKSTPIKEIDAKTFINVITAQKIKGSEFLKLMGNTRISNSAYREIEQNPNLTKDRLVELLEQSPLTSEDYVKILTAVKQRSELLSKKEEADRKREQAGLFTLNKPRDAASAKHELQPVPTSDTIAFAANDTAKLISIEEPRQAKAEPQIAAEEPVAPEIKEEPKAPLQNKTDEKPFIPEVKVDVSEDDEPYNPFADKQPAPEKVISPEPETGKREKYKGREYFIDDDVYYPGVNNGKIIFCAVCAVLLIAGSFGIRYLTTGSFLPTDSPVSIINHEKEEKLPEEYLSNEDIYEAISKLEAVVTRKESGYYRADSKPYEEILTKDFAESGDMIYIFSNGKILGYNLTAENPFLHKELAVDEERGFLGFAASGDKLYLLFEDEYTEQIAYTKTNTAEDGTVTSEDITAEIKRGRVTAECYDKDFSLLYKYEQDGDFVNLKANEDSISVATAINTADGAVSQAEKTYLPSYSLGETRKYVNFDSITVPDGIKYSGFTVIGTVSGGEARVSAVLGGQNGYVEFENDECQVVIPDKNQTFNEIFRFVGSNLTFVSSETYTGECYGTEFINESGDIITAYDSVNLCTTVMKKNGEEFISVSGIGAGESLAGVSYTDKYAYIVTENAEKSAMLYCVDISGTELTAAEADSEAVYTERLKKFGDKLIGMTVEADEDGNRTGLKLAVYGYDEGLDEKRSAVITVDENTAAEYLRYLSGDAEISNLRIAVDETSTMAAVSAVYFDGISEIERILCYKDDGSALNVTTDLLLFDTRSDYRFLAIRGNILYVITDKSVITVNAETGAPLGYFNEEMNSESTEITEDTAESADDSAIIE